MVVRAEHAHTHTQRSRTTVEPHVTGSCTPPAVVGVHVLEETKARGSTRTLCSAWFAGRFDVEPAAVKSDLARIQTKHNAAGSDKKALCKENLLRYYHELEAEGLLVDFPHAKKFVMCVFSTPVTTVKVESLFSVMNYNKSGSRSGLADSTVAAIAQCQMLQPQLTGGWGRRPDNADRHREGVESQASR